MRQTGRTRRLNVEGKNRINGGASAADYSSDKDTVLATFQCTVDDGASGTLKVGLDNLEFYSCQTWEDHTAEYRVIMASVNGYCRSGIRYRRNH